MARKTLCLALSIMAVSVTASCDKPSVQSGIIRIDGKADDWTGIEPLWAEAGQPGQGTFGEKIDIGQVYFTNSSDYLYVFLQTTPTVQERFDKQWSRNKAALAGVVCSLYFDTDNDRNTGCKGVRGFGYGDINGYEMQMWMPLFVWMEGPKSAGTYVGYTLHEAGQDGTFSLEDKMFEQSSDKAGSLIAHGPEGIELAIPLKVLRLRQGATVRLLLSENAHIFEEEGHNEGSFVIK